MGEGVGDLGFAEARGVVLEGESFGRVVDVEAAEAVEIGEFAEALELFVAQGRMEFVGDFEKCHAGDYSSGERSDAKDENRNSKFREELGSAGPVASVDNR